MKVLFIYAKQPDIRERAAKDIERLGVIREYARDDGQSALTVVSGSAEFGTPFGVCTVRAGAASVGARGAACTAPQPTNAAAAVGWKQAVSQ